MEIWTASKVQTNQSARNLKPKTRQHSALKSLDFGAALYFLLGLAQQLLVDWCQANVRRFSIV